MGMKFGLKDSINRQPTVKLPYVLCVVSLAYTLSVFITFSVITSVQALVISTLYHVQGVKSWRSIHRTGLLSRCLEV